MVESCLDEMEPLKKEGLLRPLDPAGVPEWENLSFTDAPGVTEDGKTWVVPLSAGPQGLIVNTEKVKDVPHSWKALFEPAVRRRGLDRGRLRAAGDRRGGAGDGD